MRGRAHDFSVVCFHHRVIAICYTTHMYMYRCCLPSWYNAITVTHSTSSNSVSTAGGTEQLYRKPFKSEERVATWPINDQLYLPEALRPKVLVHDASSLDHHPQSSKEDIVEFPADQSQWKYFNFLGRKLPITVIVIPNFAVVLQPLLNCCISILQQLYNATSCLQLHLVVNTFYTTLL